MGRMLTPDDIEAIRRVIREELAPPRRVAAPPEPSDPWLEPLRAYLPTVTRPPYARHPQTTAHAALEALGVPVAEHTTAALSRAGNLLRSLGWRRAGRMGSGRRPWYYEPALC